MMHIFVSLHCFDNNYESLHLTLHICVVHIFMPGRLVHSAGRRSNMLSSSIFVIATTFFHQREPLTYLKEKEGLTLGSVFAHAVGNRGVPKPHEVRALLICFGSGVNSFFIFIFSFFLFFTIQFFGLKPPLPVTAMHLVGQDSEPEVAQKKNISFCCMYCRQ